MLRCCITWTRTNRLNRLGTVTASVRLRKILSCKVSHMNRFHGIVGAPELEAQAGTSFRLTQRLIRIDAQGGFRDLALAQLDGTLLALDWVVGAAHHIWGSAVLVAPGVALTARHVVDEMRDNPGGLLALGFHNDGMVIWHAKDFTYIDDSDLSFLTLVNATAQPANAAKKAISINVATLAARQPLMGESISLVGFKAHETKFEYLTHGRGAAVALLGSVGPVIDVYREGRDRSRRNPSAGVIGEDRRWNERGRCIRCAWPADRNNHKRPRRADFFHFPVMAQRVHADSGRLAARTRPGTHNPACHGSARPMRNRAHRGGQFTCR